MAQQQAKQIFISPNSGSAGKLPGAVVLPDATKKTPLGSGQITSVISSGGTAIIYEIWNSELEVTRAVKLLHPDHTRESEERFQTEMKITAKLHHPNIVEIYAVGHWNSLPYIEMERIDGYTLEDLIERKGALPMEVCTAIGVMVGRALNHAHNQEYMIYGTRYQGIIHRDLKPSNIMIDKNGMVKLMDFGIAKPVTATMHTMEGTVVGTMQYLPPEQLNGEPVDVRADMYSLGAVMYEMITGSRIFPETNLAKLVTDKLNNNYVSLEDFAIRIPPRLRSLVEKCLNYQKEKRTENALTFLKHISTAHKSVTHLSPEQVMEQFMHGDTASFRKVGVRRKRNYIPALIWTVTSVVIVGSIVGITSILTIASRQVESWQKQPSATIREVKTPLPSKPDPIVMKQQADPVIAPSEDNRKVTSGTSDEPVVKTTRRTSSIRNLPSISQSGESVVKREDERVTSLQKADEIRRISSEPQAPSQPAPEPAQVEKSANAEGPVYRSSVSKVERLKSEYFTSDLMTILSSELEQGRYANAREVFINLPQAQARSVKGLLYKMRILKGLGNAQEYAQFIGIADIPDAEFYSEKGVFLYNQGNIDGAVNTFQAALRVPAILSDPPVIRRKVMYHIALCRTAQYDKNDNESTRKAAMDCWYEVKTSLRSSPDHPYFKKADAEIRRIDRSSPGASLQ